MTPDTAQHGRCDGSGQSTMYADPRATCPVCGATVAVIISRSVDPFLVPVAVLVDHAPRRTDALPLSLDLFGG